METTMSRKRKSTEPCESCQCILCKDECDEYHSTIHIDAWNNLRETAKQWSGLDTFSTVYNDVAWDNGPFGVYYHQVCKLKLFSRRKLEQALKRKEKLQTEQPDQGNSSTSTQPQDEEKRRHTRQRVGIIHDKNLCIWCLKPEDKKHRRDKWHIMQQLNAWYAFNATQCI